MLIFWFYFFYPKIVQKFASTKKYKNEFNDLQYVSYDVEASAEDRYCIILNF
jgi:hypothetical protein